MKDNFDIHAWNVKRRLSEDLSADISLNDQRIEAVAKAISETYDIDNNGYLKGTIRIALADFLEESDDPKIGAELEGDPDEKVEEGINDNVLKAKLSDLNYDILNNYFNGEKFSAPNPDDSLRSINSESSWESWKEKTMSEYGDVDVEIDNTLVWFDQFKILDKKFLDDEEEYTKLKGAALDNWRKTSNYGLDEIKETIKFIKENNPEFTTEEIANELKEIKALGNQLEEKLCPKGEAYRKRRMAAGEKSSAYLSGRAVKVCKGQMSGRKKKKK